MFGVRAWMHARCLSACLSVCRLILRGNRQSASQPEHDLESETTRQGTKCVTWAQSFSLSLKTERERETERGRNRGREREREKASPNPLHSEAN